MAKDTETPATFEEAVSLGFEPVKDISVFLAEELGLSLDSFSFDRSAEAAAGRMDNCATAPAGAPCFDFCYSNGVRILAYCGPNRQCDRFVKGTCDPY